MIESQNESRDSEIKLLHAFSKLQSDENRYKISKDETSNNISLSKNMKPHKSIKSKFLNSINTVILHQSNSYVNWGITKEQPEISRANFPFCLEDEEIEEQKKKKQKIRLKITNRVKPFQKQNQQSYEFRNKIIEKQEAPVNQYLCYDLSQQITEGLYDVRILAEQIKGIKKQKQALLEQKQKFKPSSKIRIKREYKVKGSWVGQKQSKKSDLHYKF